MALNSVFLGQAFTANVRFLDDAGLPFSATEGVKYTVRDFNNRLVVTGTAAQDTEYPELWSASITIPTSAPTTSDGDRYVIVWSAKNATDTLRTTESFSVKAAIDFRELSTDLMVIEKSELQDTLVVNSSITVSGFTIKLIKEDGTVIYEDTATNPTPVEADGRRIYSYSSPDPIDELVVDVGTFRPLLIEWKYTVAGLTHVEYHFLYVVNPKMLMQLRDLRMFIDKARSEHPNPALRYSDTDLLTYIDQGMQMLNASKPTLTDWGITTIPTMLVYGLNMCAAYCALSAQYLAEGQAAFDFSGQAVSLNVDRTQFIDSALGRIMDWISNSLPSAKRLAVRSGGIGTLGIHIGPSTGWAGPSYRLDQLRRLMLSGYGRF